MDEDSLFELLRRGLKSFADDVYLLEHNVAERAVTAKLGCHLQFNLPAVVGIEKYRGQNTAERLHVDCEYNRLGDKPKWILWEAPIMDPERKTVYYNPSPDIILHRRGCEGPNVLVIEAKKEGQSDNLALLLDRMKLVAYLDMPLRYQYGLYLCLRSHNDGSVVAAAELIDRKSVELSSNAGCKELWNSCRELVEKGIKPSGRVSIHEHLSADQDEHAGELCTAIQRQFSFIDVAARLNA